MPIFTQVGSGSIKGFNPLSAGSSGASGRGIFVGGSNTSSVIVSTIDYITITAPGNAVQFGSLSLGRTGLGATSNGSLGRGVFGGGIPSGSTGVANVDYVTIATLGNAASFGSLSQGRTNISAVSNGSSSRAVFAGGLTSGTTATDVATIDYLTITTLGNAAAFGSLDSNRDGLGGVSNGTLNRGVYCGGTLSGSYPYGNVMLYITITTPGNSASFGTLASIHYMPGACSNDTLGRGVIAGGGTTWSATAITGSIEYFTISTTGSVANFGSLYQSRLGMGGVSNGTGNVGVFGGGTTSGYVDAASGYSTIDSINIQNTGNATLFGQLSVARSVMAGTA